MKPVASRLTTKKSSPKKIPQSPAFPPWTYAPPISAAPRPMTSAVIAEHLARTQQQAQQRERIARQQHQWIAVRNPPQSRTICSSGVANQSGKRSAITMTETHDREQQAKNPTTSPLPNRRTSICDSRSLINV